MHPELPCLKKSKEFGSVGAPFQTGVKMQLSSDSSKVQEIGCGESFSGVSPEKRTQPGSHDLRSLRTKEKVSLLRPSETCA